MMRTRARSMLVVGLLGGGLLVASSAAGTTETPPGCDDVEQLVSSHRPSEALVLAEKVGATREPPLSVAEGVCSEQLGSAEADAGAARAELWAAQGNDAAASLIEATNEDAAESLREKADSQYMQALALDVGLQEAVTGLAHEGADNAKLVAAEALQDLGYSQEAEALVLEGVKEGSISVDEATSADVGATTADRVISWGGRVTSGWLALVGWVLGVAVVAFLVLRAVRRPRTFDVQSPKVESAPGKALEGTLSTQWGDALSGELVQLEKQDRRMRFVAAPDTTLTLPTIQGMPTGFKAAVEFWNWFKQVRMYRVTARLHVVEGRQHVQVTLRKRFGTLVASDDLACIEPDLTAEAACMSLVPAVATWLLFQSTPVARRQAFFGSTEPEAVAMVAAAARSTHAKPDGRRWALARALTVDPAMLEARLNLAVLETITPAGGPFALDPESLQQGIAHLRQIPGAVSRSLLMSAVEPVSSPEIEEVRLKALVMRAHYNLVIAHLNRIQGPEAGGYVSTYSDVTLSIHNTTVAIGRLRNCRGLEDRAPLAMTAGKIEKHLSLLRRAYLGDRRTFLARLEENLCGPQAEGLPDSGSGGSMPVVTVARAGGGVDGVVVGVTGPVTVGIPGPVEVTVSGGTPGELTASTIAVPAQYPSAMPAWVDYTVACIVAGAAREPEVAPADRRLLTTVVARWIYSATSKEPLLKRFWTHDPAFRDLSIQVPLPVQPQVGPVVLPPGMMPASL